MYYFISDTHFGHKNLVYGCSAWEDKSLCRQFSSIDEHDNIILDNINSRVRTNDTLIHIGDFAICSKAQLENYRSRIKCKNIVLVYGNHDDMIVKSARMRNLFLSCQEFLNLRFENQKMVVCHYPLMSWNKMRLGSWMIHGHCHNNICHKDHGKILDVGLEGNNMKPWSFNEVKEYMDSKQIIKVDHH